MEEYFLPANQKMQEYNQMNGELKDIAWKLYDLTCDFKDLQVDCNQLCKYGRYDRYAEHKKTFSSSASKERKISSTDTRSRTESESENVRSNDEFVTNQKESVRHKGFSRDDEDDREERSKKKKFAAAEKCKQKFLMEIDQELATRRSKHIKKFEEDIARYKKPASSASPARHCSEYKSLSTVELEQRLREKLDLLQAKARHLKESYYKKSTSGNIQHENQSNGDLEEEFSSYQRSEELPIRTGCPEQSARRNSVICCRGKQRLSNQHTPHRVYLDGGRTYVVDHLDSKVVFIPKPNEY